MATTNKYKKAFKLFKEIYAYQTRWFDSDIEYKVENDGIEISDGSGTFHEVDQAIILSNMVAGSWYVTHEDGKTYARIF